MKRAISITCAAVLLFSMICLVGCGGSIDGSYKLVEFTADGEDAMRELGDAMITLEVNGTTATMMGTDDISGNSSEQLTVDTKNQLMTDDTGSSVPYTVEGNRLSLHGNGYVMVFEK